LGVFSRRVGLLAAASAALGACQPWARRLEALTAGGPGPPTFVLLHGYGSTPEAWQPFATTIANPWPGRFVFPRGPETTVPPDGPVGGRAWWRLDLASHIPPGRALPDLSATQPPGIVRAAKLVRALLTDLPRGPVVLGGFSQGAMVAAEIAFTSDQPLAALVLLSGTAVDESKWERGLARRRGLPVFISHGRRDDILSFAIAERLRTKLAAAGMRVTWAPFDGGHEIPEATVVSLNSFLPLEK
jgi:phospholipase/carboxylesterase